MPVGCTLEAWFSKAAGGRDAREVSECPLKISFKAKDEDCKIVRGLVMKIKLKNFF